MQQTGSVQRTRRPNIDVKAADPIFCQSSQPLRRLKIVIGFFNKITPPLDITNYYVVDKNTLTVYDKDGKLKSSFVVQRPGRIDVTGYYVAARSYGVGWAWASETSKGKYGFTGLSEKGMREAKERLNRNGNVAESHG